MLFTNTSRKLQFLMLGKPTNFTRNQFSSHLWWGKPNVEHHEHKILPIDSITNYCNPPCILSETYFPKTQIIFILIRTRPTKHPYMPLHFQSLLTKLNGWHLSHDPKNFSMHFLSLPSSLEANTFLILTLLS